MKIEKDQFAKTFEAGIETDNKRLGVAAKHAGVPVADIKALDSNGDGLINGPELERLHDFMDSLDPHDSGVDLGRNADGKVGPDTVLYHGLAESIADPRERIVAIARSSQADPRLDEGYKGSERMVSHNTMHGGKRDGDLIQTRFEDTYKCNLFVGDVLWRAGLQVPSHSNQEQGWTHIGSAESWGKSNLFKTVSVDDLQPGDVMFVDDPNIRGSGGAHLEIVTGVTSDGIVTIGSRWGENGIFEDTDRSNLMRDAVEVSPGVYEDESGYIYKFLRHRDLESPTRPIRA